MNEPRKNREFSRLRDGSDDPFIRGLLESAKGDGPRPGSKAALVTSLGIGVGGPLLLGAEAARAAATTASSLAGASASSAVTSGAATGGYVSLFGKWLAIGVASTTLVMSEARVDVSQADSSPRDAAAVAMVEASRANALAERASNGVLDTIPEDEAQRALPTDAVPTDVPAVDTLARASSKDKAPSTRAVVKKSGELESPPAIAPTDAKTLIDEVRALDDARAALERGDVAKASSTLTNQGALFERGSLGQEADVLAIEIASRRGDSAATQALGQAFLAKYPSSPHRGRVESLLRVK